MSEVTVTPFRPIELLLRFDLSFSGTDCHVQIFFSSDNKDGPESEVRSLSQANYRQAATMVRETKKILLQQIEALGRPKQTGGIGRLQECLDEVDCPTDLLRQTNLALARILSKQGCVYARVKEHTMALVRRLILP